MKSSIGSLLIVIFVAISLLGTSIGAYFLYAQVNDILTQQVYNGLAGAVQAKANNLKTYITGIERETAQGASRVTFSKLLATDKNSSGYASALDSAQASIEQLQKTDPSYDEVFLMGMDGRIVISSNKNTIGADKSTDPFFTEGQEKVAIKDVYYSSVTGRLQIGASSPVFDSSGKLVGVYAARINTEELDQITNDRTGLGQSGEMVLLNRQSYPITPLRYRENSVLNFLINTTVSQDCLEDMVEYYNATDGSVGAHNDSVVLYDDYRGVKSLGTHSYVLPQAPWCVIAKIDEAEALGAPRSQLLGSVMLIDLGVIIASAIAIYAASGFVSSSIKRLSDDVARITKGDLDIRLKPSGIIEIQSLNDSLSRVFASLKLAVLRTGMSKEDMGIGEALTAKKEAEERYAALFNSINDIVTVNKISPEGPGKFVDVNDYACTALGYSRKELLNMGPHDLDDSVKPDDARTADNVKQMLSGKTLEYTSINRTKGGRKLTLQLRMRLISFKGEKYIISTGRDISSEVESKERIRLFELGFDSSPDSQLMVQYTDGTPKIVKVNASFTKYYGYAPKEVLGKNPRVLKSGVQKPEYYKRMWTALLDPKVGYWRDEIINKRKDGSMIEVLLVANTIFGKDGKPNAFLASHLDMSGQKKAEKELSTSKELQQAALDSIRDSFFVCDIKGRLLSWNKEFRESTGYSDKEIAQLHATDLFSRADSLRVAAAIRKGMKAGSAVVAANVIAKNKRLLPTEFSGSVMKDANGKIIGFAGVGRRLGERKK